MQGEASVLPPLPAVQGGCVSRRRPIPEVNIVELWEAYGGTLTGADRSEWRKATCVLHDDNTASASVNEEAGRFHCFVCSIGGDAIQLIMEVENVDFKEALTIAEGRSGGRVRQSSSYRSTVRRPGRRQGNWTPPWKR